MHTRRMNLLFMADQLEAGRDLCCFARYWLEQTNEKWTVDLLAFGPGQEPALQEMACQQGQDVTWLRVENVRDDCLVPELLSRALEDFLGKRVVDLFVMQDRGIAQEVIPFLSARLGVPCVTGVEAIKCVEGGGLRLRTSLMGGKLWSWSDVGLPLLLSVVPGSFSAVCPDKQICFGQHGVRLHYLSIEDSRCRLSVDRAAKVFSRDMRQDSKATDERRSLQEADVILGVGQGLGNRENLDLIRQGLRFFPKAELAGSRPVCDQGWLPYARQVGATGLTVKPELYLALGVSGAPQHIQGMQDSKYVVAINKDPQAAVFNYADLGIVDDLPGFWQDFIQLMEKGLSED